MSDRPDLFVDRLIGRDEDLTALLETLSTARLVTLTGPGGSGKTRLASAVVTSLRNANRHAWFVDCTAVEDAAIVGATIAAAMDLHDPIGPDVIDLVIAALDGQEAVIALDNLEQIDGAGDVAIRLTEAVPGLAVIATSRMPLSVKGEVEFAVAPLALPSDASASTVAASAAGALFIARAGALSTASPIDDATAADIAALLHRLDGLPLAIELAAARTRAMSPGEINQRLDARGPAAIDAQAGDHHRSLLTIIDWTVGQLAADDAEVLEAVAVTAGFDLALVESLVPDRDPLRGIESLMTLGLVQRFGMVAGVTRFRLFQTIQAIVIGRLSAERSDTLRRRHAMHFLALASDWDRAAAQGGMSALSARFDADADNVRRALDYLETADPRAGLTLLARLGAFWASHGRLVEGFLRLERARSNTPEPTVELVRAASSQLSSVWPLVSPSEILALIDWTIDAARTVGDAGALVEALRQRAYHAFNEQDLPGVLAATDEIEGISSELDTLGHLNRADVRALAAAAIDGRTSDRHVELMRAYLVDLESAGMTVRLALAEGNLAGALLGRGEYDEAIRYARHAAEVFLELGRPDELAWALAFVGPSLAEAGRTAEAVEAAIECASIAADVGYPEHIASALWAAIPVALALGLPVLAARLWGTLVPGMHARGDVVLNPLDADLADAWFKRAEQAASAISVELAVREGVEADPAALVRELPSLLQAPSGPLSPGGVLRHGVLTRREVEVLSLVGQGRSDPEIGDALFISPKTASVHVTNIKGKLGVQSRLQVALRARELGLVKSSAKE